MKKLIQAVTLSQLSDGYSGKLVDQAINQAYQDLYERGQDGKPRKVIVTYILQPEQNNQLKIDTKVKVVVPDMQPPSTIAKLDAKAGGMVFNPDCADNPDQLTIPLDVQSS